jgi:hypothetical protein
VLALIAGAQGMLAKDADPAERVETVRELAGRRQPLHFKRA